MKAFYAHDEKTYGTASEDGDIDHMGRLGFNVLSLNCPEIQTRMEMMRNDGMANEIPRFVRSLIDTCDSVFFRAELDKDGKHVFPDAVRLAVLRAVDTGKPVFEVPLVLPC